MAIVGRSPHHSWVPLVVIVGAMLATANASACEMGDNRGCLVAHDVKRASVSRLSNGALDSLPSRSGINCVSAGARSDGRSTLRSGRRSRLRFDAEDWEDPIDGDDDTDLPARVGFRNMVRYIRDPILPEGDARAALIGSPSALFPSSHPLRC
jgi:hypothetical protein